MPRTEDTTARAPKAEYAVRLERRRAEHARAEAAFDRIANARLAVFFGGVVLAIAAYQGLLSWWWLTGIVGAFLVLVVWHARVERRRDRAQVLAAYYEAGVARIDGEWIGTGLGGEDFMPHDHPCAADLDLFGTGSLFERLCRAQTRHGERTLAEWLLAPASPETVRARQTAIAELRDHLDLREDLVLLGRDVRAGVHVETLNRWADAPSPISGRWAIVGAVVLLGAGIVAAMLWWLVDIQPLFMVVLLLDILFFGLTARMMKTVAVLVDAPARELEVLSGLLARFETVHFNSPLLTGWQDALRKDGLTASARMRQLERRARMLEQMANQIFFPFALVTHWGVFWSWSIEQWRAENAHDVPKWLEALGALEAMSSLAAYHFECPDDPFPQLVEGPPRFEAENMGHPLFHTGKFVRNDVSLNSETRLLLVSGSNMSGKSTLLRCIGANAVLAQAGGPVRCAKLVMTPLAVGATLRVVDSLQEGASRFYAEIQRLKHLQDMAKGEMPLLFLLDEILHGTNSHDRVQGASALLHAYVRAGAIGLCTTHDLAITEVANDAALHARNVHFEDHFENGKLAFDYTMREGIVTKSNAQALMRQVGLEI